MAVALTRMLLGQPALATEPGCLTVGRTAEAMSTPATPPGGCEGLPAVSAAVPLVNVRRYDGRCGVGRLAEDP